MGKQAISGVIIRKNANGNKTNKKASSHGTFRCVRKPNSPQCKKQGVGK
jgi:hypothetical protein